MAGWNDVWPDWSEDGLTGCSRGVILGLASALNERLKAIGSGPEVSLDSGDVLAVWHEILAWISDDDDDKCIWRRPFIYGVPNRGFLDYTEAEDGEFTEGVRIDTKMYSVSKWYGMGVTIPTYDPANPGIAAGTHFLYGTVSFGARGRPITSHQIWSCYTIINSCRWLYEGFGMGFYVPLLNANDRISGTRYVKQAGEYFSYESMIAAWPAAYDVFPDEYGPLTASVRKTVYGWSGVRAVQEYVYTSPTDELTFDADLYVTITNGYGIAEPDPPYSVAFDGEGIFSGPGDWRLAQTFGNVETTTLDVTGVFSDGPPEVDFTQFLYSVGTIDGDYSGEVSSITVSYDADPGNVGQTGLLALLGGYEEYYDVFTYTSVSGTGLTRTFSGDPQTLTGIYTSSDSAYSTPDPEYDPDLEEPFSIGWGENIQQMSSVVVKFDVEGGFEYVN